MSETEYVQFAVRFRGETARAHADRLIAETWDAGASGHEEREGREGGEGFIEVMVYCAKPRSAEVWSVARARNTALETPTAVDPVDWVERWRQNLRPTIVGGLLVVRPESLSHALLPGQKEVVIEPGQAFGTGGHASTRLILEWLVSGELELQSSVRVLDVGVGSGVLALAALRLGAGHAIGFDLDLCAVREAGRAGRENGLAERLGLMAGPIEALGEGRFELILANLLKRELLPLVNDLAGHLAAGGSLLVSGLLHAERSEVEARMGEVGLRCVGERVERDTTGDTWLSLRWTQA